MTTVRAPTPRLMTVEHARRLVLEQARPLGIEEVALSASLGRVVAQDLTAKTALPPFDNSAMDGYALRSSDTAQARRERCVTLRVVGEVAAGRVLERAVGCGEAVKIMTGAPLPPGADSVVMLEETRLREGLVEIVNPVPRGSHVRNAGEDIRASDIALRQGTRIRVTHLGLLAGLGYAQVPVFRAPRIAILATGSELVDLDEPLGPGKIRNSNSLTLVSLLHGLGVAPTDLGAVSDDGELIRRRLEQAAACDVLLISGGVSVGAHDLVKRILRELGMETIFWRVNMKPGKPLLFGTWRGTAVFGLPGNPISCVVCFLEFIAPYVRAVMGDAHPLDDAVQARLTQAVRKQEPRTLLLTAQLREEEGSLLVTPTPQQGSGMLSSLAQANAFIVVPEEVMQLEAGAVVAVRPLGGSGWPS